MIKRCLEGSNVVDVGQLAGIAVADAYFSGLQKNDGKGVNGTGTYPFTNDCHRIENGAPTTNVPRPPNEPKDAVNGFAHDKFLVPALKQQANRKTDGCAVIGNQHSFSHEARLLYVFSLTQYSRFRIGPAGMLDE